MTKPGSAAPETAGGQNQDDAGEHSTTGESRQAGCHSAPLAAHQLHYSNTFDGTHCVVCGCELPNLGAVTNATPSTSVAWGAEKQDYPGGPVYRVGTSTGAGMAAQPITPQTDMKGREQ